MIQQLVNLSNQILKNTSSKLVLRKTIEEVEGITTYSYVITIGNTEVYSSTKVFHIKPTEKELKDYEDKISLEFFELLTFKKVKKVCLMDLLYDGLFRGWDECEYRIATLSDVDIEESSYLK